MSLTCESDQITPVEWSAAVSRFADFSIYQTWAFGEVSAADTRSQVSRAVFRRGDTIVGAAQLRIKRLPLLNAGLAYCYFGPMWRREHCTTGDWNEVIVALREEYGGRRGLEVRLVPNLSIGAMSESVSSLLGSAGFPLDASISAYRTIVIDLGSSPESLRKQLAQKWRNGLNQAEKRGVRVESSTKDAAMDRFERLYDAMWSKKQFETGVAVSSFCRLQRMLPPSEKMTVRLAFVGDEIAAGHVSSTLGDTCVYLLGASNDLGREYKASYALQWQALLGAREAGALRYDLGGVDPEMNPGVYHFKAGLGGVETTHVGQFTAKGRGSARYLVPLAERAYRALRPTRRIAGS